MNHREATDLAAAGVPVELVTLDGTLTWVVRVSVWIDDDGILTQPHPTDPRRGPIAAPVDGRYVRSAPLTDEWGVVVTSGGQS
jgi:hypothetical protein